VRCLGAGVSGVLLAASLAGAGAFVACRPGGSGPTEVELVARAPERGNWSPQVIRVTRGREVTIVIRNTDVVTHGFYLPALGLHVSEIKAGDVARISLTPTAAGEFPFYCSVWCGDYHLRMRGTLVVEEPALASR